MRAADLEQRIRLEVDDPVAVRTTPARMLRVLTRAQEWVALRYQLLRTTVTVPLTALVPWYDLQRLPTPLVTVTHVAYGGAALRPVPWRVLRYAQPHWLAPVGTPRHYYRLGLRYLGLHPRPHVADVPVLVTGCYMPRALVSFTQALEIPDSYVAHVVLMAAGLLMIGQDKNDAEAVQRLQSALRVQLPATRRKQEDGNAHAVA